MNSTQIASAALGGKHEGVLGGRDGEKDLTGASFLGYMSGKSKTLTHQEFQK